MIDELLSDLAAQGWLINNCYQPDGGLWRLSLRRPTPTGDWFSDWAEGPTFEDALTECMSKLLDAEFTADTPQQYSLEPKQSLIAVLGLLHAPLTRPIIKRRL
jgi:hypothetical protein